MYCTYFDRKFFFFNLGRRTKAKVLSLFATSLSLAIFTPAVTCLSSRETRQLRVTAFFSAAPDLHVAERVEQPGVDVTMSLVTFLERRRVERNDTRVIAHKPRKNLSSQNKIRTAHLLDVVPQSHGTCERPLAY